MRSNLLLSPEELLNKISNAPEYEILKQVELFEWSFPLLIMIARDERRKKGALNKTDKLMLSAEELKALVFLFESNYWLFLVVIGDFTKIHEIFGPYLSEKQAMLLYMLEKEEINLKRHEAQYLLVNQAATAVLKTPLTKVEEVKPPLLDWLFYAANMPPMELYHCYDLMLKKAEFEYKTVQANIYYDAVNARIDRLQRVVGLIRANENIPSAEKEEILRDLEEQLEQLATGQEVLRPINGQLLIASSVDEQQGLAIRKLFTDSSNTTELLEKIAHYDPQIREIAKEEKEGTLGVDLSLQDNKVKYEEKTSILLSHMKTVEKLSKEDIGKSLDALINCQRDWPTKKMSIEQKNILDKHIRNLREYREKLKTDEDGINLDKTCSLCFKEIQKIEGLVSKSLPNQFLQDFKKEIDLFCRASGSAASVGGGLQSVLPYAIPVLPEEAKTVVDNELDASLSVAEEEPSLKPSFLLSEESREVFDDELSAEERSTERSRSFRAQIQNLRSSITIMDFPKEKQSKLADVINGLSQFINKAMEEGILTPDNISKVEELLELKNSINNKGFDKVNRDEIKSLFTILNELEDEDLAKIKEDLSSIFSFLEPSALNSSPRLS